MRRLETSLVDTAQQGVVHLVVHAAISEFCVCAVCRCIVKPLNQRFYDIWSLSIAKFTEAQSVCLNTHKMKSNYA